MKNVKKVIKATVFSVAASAMLCIPVGAQTPERKPVDSEIILQNLASAPITCGSIARPCPW
ncbi:hypothetical protein [Paenibacillus hamazuiensis]|uniref:hypothetical protein n=1 Tax=Paenibacillus hamazuiensis TaxID=2936508 RepID=UPI00200BCAD3|nr:hypothetical protein [Paenibacillus hamazuiensis]